MTNPLSEQDKHHILDTSSSINRFFVLNITLIIGVDRLLCTAQHSLSNEMSRESIVTFPTIEDESSETSDPEVHSGFDLAFDSRIGWTQVCKASHEKLCRICGWRVFVEKDSIGQLLRSENDDIPICTPCKHGWCSGARLRLITFCPNQDYGYEICGNPSRDEEKEISCCQCRKRENLAV